MELEIEVENNKLVLSIRCIVYQKKIGDSSIDFAVTLKQVWDINGDTPAGVTQEVWDSLKDLLKKLNLRMLL